MEWKDEHDVILCREILVARPFQFKARTVESGCCWGSIADRLNECQLPKFKVTKRAVRDRFKILTDKYKRKMRDEEKASGVDIEPQSELEQLIENLIEEEEVAIESAMEEGTTKSMEKVGETRKRKEESGEGEGAPVKTSRRGSNDTIEFLREKSERDFVLREKELELKKLEQGQSSERIDQLAQQQSQMMALVQQQMKQQSDMMMAFVKKFQ